MNTTSRNILIGVVAALAVIGIYAVVAHKNIAGPWFSQPIGSNTAALPPGTEDTSTWKRYTNSAYHFTFLYPAYFGDISAASSSGRQVVRYSPNTGKSTEKKIMPFLALWSSSDPNGDRPDLTLSLNIFKAAEYGFEDVPGGRAWSYSSSVNAMWMGKKTGNSWGDWKKVAATLEGTGWKGYDMDAGNSLKVAAIPLRRRVFMLEMAFGSGPAAKGQIPANEILATLKVQ